eukprot:UN02954
MDISSVHDFHEQTRYSQTDTLTAPYNEYPAETEVTWVAGSLVQLPDGKIVDSKNLPLKNSYGFMIKIFWFGVAFIAALSLFKLMNRNEKEQEFEEP